MVFLKKCLAWLKDGGQDAFPILALIVLTWSSSAAATAVSMAKSYAFLDLSARELIAPFKKM